MVSSETELKDDVREMTNYTSTNVLSNDGLDTAYRTAKRHIRIRKTLAGDFDWYGEENLAARHALFWYTCLWSKVQTGELDSQSLQAGAVNADSLLAKQDNQVTEWYRNAHSALESIKATNIMRFTSPARTDRDYEPGDFDLGSGTGTADGPDL